MYYEDNSKKRKKKKKKQKKSPLLLILIIAAIVAGIVIIIIVSTKNPAEKPAKDDISASSEQIVSDNKPEEPAISSNDVSEEPLEEKEPVYRDLTLEEAWPIALERNMTMTVTSGNVNVREKPTTDSEKVGTVKENSTVYIICEEDTNDGYTWCYVIYDKAASERGTDSDGNTMITIENKHFLGYIRKDLLTTPQ